VYDKVATPIKETKLGLPVCYCRKIRRILIFHLNLYSLKDWLGPDHSKNITEEKVKRSRYAP
jgi:hypothetical protein